MPPQVSLRALGPTVFFPALLYAVGRGAIAPAMALSALDLGASVGVASLVVGMSRFGQLLGDLPAGALAARLGERTAMLLASCLAVVALVVCLSAGSVIALGVAICCTGMASAAWELARQTYVTEVVPVEQRARALSTLGGIQRIGMFFGPFLGAGAMRLLGTDGAYWVHLVAAVAAALALLALPALAGDRAAPTSERVIRGTAGVIREQVPVLRTLGIAVLLVGAVRASRQAVVPLWAEHEGLDPATTSLVFGVSGAVDMLLFYPAGKVMDRSGRAWVAVPSMLILGLGHLLMPLAHDTATIALAAGVMGVGNGIGSGLIMTIGADVAPAAHRPEFLGAWRLCSDFGGSVGPSAVGAVTAATSLAPALVVVAALAGLSALALGRWIPRQPAPA